MIDEMSARDLQMVREFLAFIASRDTNAVTRELLAIPGFEKSLKAVATHRARILEGAARMPVPPGRLPVPLAKPAPSARRGVSL